MLQQSKLKINKGFPYSSLEGSFEACKLIEHTAQGPDVTLLVVRLPFTQLWGNVAWSPNHLQECEHKMTYSKTPHITIYMYIVVQLTV